MTQLGHDLAHRMGRFVDHTSWFAVLLAGCLMMAVALFMSFEAFSRHFLNSPTSWVLAVSIFIFMWFVFLSTPYGIKVDKHVACDVFVSRLPDDTRQTLGIATDILSSIYILSMGYFGYTAFAEALDIGSMSEGLVRYPIWLLLLSIPSGMILCTLQILRKIQLRIRCLHELKMQSEKLSGLRPVPAIVFFLISIRPVLLFFL